MRTIRTDEALREFINSRISSNLSPRSIEWYEHRLRSFAKFCPNLPCRPEPIEDFLATVQGSPENKALVQTQPPMSGSFTSSSSSTRLRNWVIAGSSSTTSILALAAGPASSGTTSADFASLSTPTTGTTSCLPAVSQFGSLFRVKTALVLNPCSRTP